jgi:hypothetical protein
MIGFQICKNKFGLPLIFYKNQYSIFNMRMYFIRVGGPELKDWVVIEADINSIWNTTGDALRVDINTPNVDFVLNDNKPHNKSNLDSFIFHVKKLSIRNDEIDIEGIVEDEKGNFWHEGILFYTSKPTV